MATSIIRRSKVTVSHSAHSVSYWFDHFLFSTLERGLMILEAKKPGVRFDRKCYNQLKPWMLTIEVGSSIVRISSKVWFKKIKQFTSKHSKTKMHISTKILIYLHCQSINSVNASNSVNQLFAISFCKDSIFWRKKKKKYLTFKHTLPLQKAVKICDFTYFTFYI